MEQTTLKYLRVFIPGIIFLLGFYPAYNHYFKDVYDAKSLDLTYVTYLSLIVGSIYYQLNVRYLIIYFSLKEIDRNISAKLIEIHGNLTENQKKIVENDEVFPKNVLYRIIDNDESLKKRANNVYFNGIFWTSTADSVILSAFFAIIYRFLLPNVANAVILSEMFFTISIASFLLHILSVFKHIRLSNNQLDYIKTYKSAEVVQQINDFLHQMP